MKISEIKELDINELKTKVVDLKETLFNFRFQHEIGQLENPKKILHTRKDIARVMTIIKKKENK